MDDDKICSVWIGGVAINDFMLTKKDAEWKALKTTPNDVEFDKDIQAIHCDTRDFYILRSLDKPEFNKNPRCNYDYWQNEGIKRINSLLKQKKQKQLCYIFKGNSTVAETTL